MKIVFAFALLLAALELRAQNYSVDWHKTTGGGGTSSNANYSVTGTIGQPDAGGSMSGGNYSATGGFWSLISVVQTPGAPTLYVSHAGNVVTVFWQNVSGWNLQQNGNLAITNGWSASTGISTNSGTNFWSVSNPTGNLFFRLKNP
jgi:hypothetical protein